MAMVDKPHLFEGDKILLPPSALNTLSRMEVEYPMLFELKNDRLGRKVRIGFILEPFYTKFIIDVISILC